MVRAIRSLKSLRKFSPRDASTLKFSPQVQPRLLKPLMKVNNLADFLSDAFYSSPSSAPNNASISRLLISKSFLRGVEGFRMGGVDLFKSFGKLRSLI